MADEVPGEAPTEVQEIEAQEEAGEEIQGEVYGEAEEQHSTTGTLVSDFCEHEQEFEAGEEGEGEGYWVCREEEVEGEFEEKEWEYQQEEQLAAEEEEQEDAGLMRGTTLDSDYLKAVLGTPLTFALLDIANKRPTDPIQYLGSYLLKWRWANEDKSEYEKRMKELDAERETYREQLRERERQIMLENAEREEELMRGEREESSVDDDDDENVGEGQLLGMDG